MPGRETELMKKRKEGTDMWCKSPFQSTGSTGGRWSPMVQWAAQADAGVWVVQADLRDRADPVPDCRSQASSAIIFLLVEGITFDL